MTTISRGASNTDRSIATMTSQIPRIASGARSPRFEPLPRTLNPRVFAVLARSLGGGHVGDRRVDLAA